jgi:VanZ family protein
MSNSAHHGPKNPKLWQAALVCYWGLLFVGTHIPSRAPFLPSGGVDKIVHVVAYAGLTTLVAITWQLSAGHLMTRHLIWLWLFILCFAAIDEWTQIPVGRDGSFWDWLADAAGALVALSLFAWWRPSPGLPPGV